MKKTLKHLFSAAICAIMLFACVFANFAAADTELNPAPANSSGWFLPSLGQCWYWMYNKAYLLSAVNKATGDNDYGWKLGYWSSSEDDYDPFLNAYYADTYVGAIDWDYKNSKHCVLACLAF